jgi:hypothetical protein
MEPLHLEPSKHMHCPQTTDSKSLGWDQEICVLTCPPDDSNVPEFEPYNTSPFFLLLVWVMEATEHPRWTCIASSLSCSPHTHHSSLWPFTFTRTRTSQVLGLVNTSDPHCPSTEVLYAGEQGSHWACHLHND